jgi:hypothetical protein
MISSAGLWVHLARKEWRYAWGWLLLAWAATGSLWLHLLGPWRGLGLSGGPARDLGLLHTLLVSLVVLLVQSRLFQMDPLFGTTSFWVTRPIGRWRLLFAKVAVAGMALVLPCSLIETAPLAAMGLHLPLRDLVLSAAGTVLWYSALCAVGAVPAVLTRGLTTMVLSSLGGGIAGLLLFPYAGRPYLNSPGFFDGTLHGAAVEAGRAVTLAALAVGSSLAILVTLSRSGRRRETLILVGLSIVAVFVWDRSWSGGLLKTLAPPRTGAAASVLVNPIQASLGRGGYRQGGLRFPDRRPGAPAPLSVSFSLTGLPEGLVVEQTGYETTARVGGQDQRRVRVEWGRWLGSPNGLWPNAIEMALDCREPHIHPPWESNEAPPDEPSFEIFQVAPASETDRSTPGLSEVRGTLFMSVVRPRLVARAPARTGETLEVPGHRFRIVGVSHERLPLQIRMIHDSVEPPLFRRAFATPAGWIVLHNPARKECLHDNTYGSGSPLTFGLPFLRSDSAWVFNGGMMFGSSHWPGAWRWRAPPDWLEGAEIVLLSVDEVRRAEVPFELARFPEMRDVRPPFGR